MNADDTDKDWTFDMWLEYPEDDWNTDIEAQRLRDQALMAASWMLNRNRNRPLGSVNYDYITVDDSGTIVAGTVEAGQTYTANWKEGAA